MGDSEPDPACGVRALKRDGPFTVGMVGRIARWKGQHVFIEAFARAFPDGPERALIVGAPLFGDDDRAYAEDLHTLASELGLDGRVTFTGFVDDVERRLAELDVLVHASVVPEPFGQVVVVWHVRDRIAADYLGPRATTIVQAAARRLPAAVIANSHSTLAAIGVDGWVIPSPIPSVTFAPVKSDGPFTVGMVGRIARWKGQHVFIEAFARAFPGGPERALIIGAPLFGDDDRAYEEEIRALAEELGLDGRLTFTGFRRGR